MPGKPWTKKELEILEEEYLSDTTKEALMEMLPGRSWRGITAQSDRKGLFRSKKRPWTEEETELVLEAYCDPKRGPQWLEKELGRTPGAINIKAFRLGVVVDIDKKWELNAIETLKGTEYELIEYRPGKSLVRHKTCEHEWWVVLVDLKNYAGCPNCSHRGNRKSTKTFYLIFFPELNLYKVGITGNLDARRKKFGEAGGTLEVIDTIVFETHEECISYEKAALKKLEPYKHNTGLLDGGNTETFRWDDSRSDLKIFLDNLI